MGKFTTDRLYRCVNPKFKATIEGDTLDGHHGTVRSDRLNCYPTHWDRDGKCQNSMGRGTGWDLINPETVDDPPADRKEEEAVVVFDPRKPYHCRDRKWKATIQYENSNRYFGDVITPDGHCYTRKWRKDGFVNKHHSPAACDLFNDREAQDHSDEINLLLDQIACKVRRVQALMPGNEGSTFDDEIQRLLDIPRDLANQDK